jgi:hypothetical protein
MSNLFTFYLASPSIRQKGNAYANFFYMILIKKNNLCSLEKNLKKEKLILKIPEQRSI